VRGNAQVDVRRPADAMLKFEGKPHEAYSCLRT
jgi:hypothetical protein